MVEAELHERFLKAPTRTAQSLLQEVQERYPGQYEAHLLRTLQRRVSTWRSQMVLEFDDSLMHADALLNGSLPAPLRATPTSEAPAAASAGAEN